MSWLLSFEVSQKYDNTLSKGKLFALFSYVLQKKTDFFLLFFPYTQCNPIYELVLQESFVHVNDTCAE